MADQVEDGFWVAQMAVPRHSREPESIEIHERYEQREDAERAVARRPDQYLRPFFVLEVRGKLRTHHKRMYRQCSDCGTLVPRD